jgi:hypothetical protein
MVKRLEDKDKNMTSSPIHAVNIYGYAKSVAPHGKDISGKHFKNAQHISSIQLVKHKGQSRKKKVKHKGNLTSCLINLFQLRVDNYVLI